MKNPNTFELKTLISKESIQQTRALNDRLFSLKEAGITSRVYNQWKTLGMLHHSPLEARGWVKLSFTEYIWIQIVKDLRKFGCPLDVIQKVKDYAFQDSFTLIEEVMNSDSFSKYMVEILRISGSNDETIRGVEQHLKLNSLKTFLKEQGILLSVLQSMLNNLTLTRKEVSLYIFLAEYQRGLTAPPQPEKVLVKERRKQFTPMGIYFYNKSHTIEPSLDLDELKGIPHIKLPLVNYVKNFLLHTEYPLRASALNVLTVHETLLLQEFRRDNLKSLVVQYSKGKPVRIDTTESLKKPIEARIIDTFLKNDYADIEYTVENGQVVKFNKTTKRKL